jgi:hypothetical protein
MSDILTLSCEASGRSIARWLDFLLITSKGEQMTLRSRRLMPGLLAILVVLALAPSSFAQVQITLTPTPSPNEITTNHDAQTADPSSSGAGILVTGALLANSPLTTTTLTLTYPAAITSSPSSNRCDTSSSTSTANTPDATFLPGGNTSIVSPCPGGNGLVPREDPIQILGASGVFSSMTNTNVRLNTNLKRIEIDLPGFPSSPGNTQSGSFRVTGIRVDMNGLSAPVTGSAALGSAANNYLLSTTTYGAVNGTGAGIASVAIGAVSGGTNVGTGAILTNKTVPKGTASILLTSGFAGAWRKLADLSNTAGNPLTIANGENSTRIRLTFGTIPSGVTLNLSLTGSSTAGGTFVSTTTGTTSVTSTSNTADIEITKDSLSSTETLQVDVTSISLSSTAAVTTPGSITMTASMAPFCTTSVDANGVPTVANGYPCFTEAEVGPVTIINILPVSTTMLMPYALFLPPFDTGIAIANTTADPFGSSGGGAIPTSGTITFNFFPTTSTGGAGTPFSLTTSSTVKPGTGLSSDGTLAAGATYAVLMSQLLSAASVTGNFQGYIFIVTNFLDAHGTATISDFRTYSLTANVLVLPPPATFSRATPLSIAAQSGAEFLHY